MKKKISIVTLLGAFAIMIAGALIMSSCEGPTGPAGSNGTDGTAGTDGTDGVDGNVTCLECHNVDDQAKIASEFAGSQHSSGAIAVDYAGGRASCAECHSHEGYLEFARTGDVANDIANPSAWECQTCHELHTDFEAGDYAIRLGDPVTLYADEAIELDGGINNTCINCHQSRRVVAAYDDETEDVTNTRKFTGDDIAVYTTAAVGPAGSITLDQSGATDTLVVVFDVPLATHAYISSTHAGPHHGPQANVWSGQAAGVVDGTAYAPHADGCVVCHMGPESGHSFWPVEGNCAVCHSSDKLPGLDATADRLEAIALALAAKHAVHIDDSWETGDALFGAVHPVYASLARADFNAWWDFTLVMEDRSKGAHNPVYVNTLLTGIETQLGL
jgi:hypothetical protein